MDEDWGTGPRVEAQLSNRRCVEPAPLRQLGLQFENLGQHRQPGAEPRLRLNRALVGELGRTRSQNLANRIARNPQLARNALDPLAVPKCSKWIRAIVSTLVIPPPLLVPRRGHLPNFPAEEVAHQ
jgi:hypothetical protein